MSDESDLHRVERSLLALWAEVKEGRDRATALFERIKDMASIHDQVKTILTDTDTLVDTLIAAKEDGDAANADLLSQATALQAKVKTAVDALSSAAPASTSIVG